MEGTEIERQFVIPNLPESYRIDHSIYHEVGYVIVHNGELRVFRKKLPGRWKFAITVKEDGNLAREEWEKELPEWAFNIVWPNTKGARVHKTRHFVHYVNDFGVYLLEIDDYKKSLEGLIRLECEFKTVEAATDFVLPAWAEDAVEVTNDPRYKNKNLAVHGLPPGFRKLFV